MLRASSASDDAFDLEDLGRRSFAIFGALACAFAGCASVFCVSCGFAALAGFGSAVCTSLPQRQQKEAPRACRAPHAGQLPAAPASSSLTMRSIWPSSASTSCSLAAWAFSTSRR